MIFTNQTPREELLALIIQHERLDTRLYQLKTKKLRLGSKFSVEDEIELTGLDTVIRSIKKDYQFAMKKVHDGIDSYLYVCEDGKYDYVSVGRT